MKHQNHTLKKKAAPYLEPSNNINQDQSIGQNIVENQQQTLRQQPQSAQNDLTTIHRNR